MLGYALAGVNSLILLALNKLTVHRYHVMVLAGLALFSFAASTRSETTMTNIASQILGMGVMSIYYFSVLTNFDMPLKRWMEMYVRAAFFLALLALLIWPAVTYVTADPRLRAIYTEPSYYVFMTLPAVSYCIGCYVSQRRYGWETLVFLVTYALANSALGFLGLMLTGLMVFTPRLRGWQLLAGILAGCALAGSLYIASFNVRVRVNDFARAVASQSLSGTGSSTFALLSNVYVTSQSFLAHPVTGIGLGGYAHAYDQFIGGVQGSFNPLFLSEQLNRDDGNSMILRVATELGIPGLILLFAFIIVCARVRGSPYQTIRNAILPYLIIRTGRMGAYFTTEFFFFVGIYLLNYLQFRSAQMCWQPSQEMSKGDIAHEWQ